MMSRWLTDPVTGDRLTRGEYLSWLVQGIIRRWAFLGFITLVTMVAWLTRDGAILSWWNLGASYLALVIESVVGIAMFSQTKRDAVALREVRTISRHLEEQDRAILALLTKMHSQEDLIVQLLEAAQK